MVLKMVTSVLFGEKSKALELFLLLLLLKSGAICLKMKQDKLHKTGGVGDEGMMMLLTQIMTSCRSLFLISLSRVFGFTGPFEAQQNCCSIGLDKALLVQAQSNGPVWQIQAEEQE